MSEMLDRYRASAPSLKKYISAYAELPERPPPRRQYRLALAAAVVLILTVVLLAITLRQESRALADPRAAGAAAEREQTFAFETRSELLTAGRRIDASMTTGEVSLIKPGFRVRVESPPDNRGFERIVFPRAVYFRPVSQARSFAWIGAHLDPPAAITVRNGGAGGLSDPLGLLALLARQTSARFDGVQGVDGVPTRRYSLRSTVGRLLAVDGGRASPAVDAIPVSITVWQDRRDRLIRAVRVFELGGSTPRRLTVTTDFTRYGKPTLFRAPRGVPLVGSQPLNPVADDPIGAKVLSVLTVGTTHSSRAIQSPAARPPRP